MFYRSSRHAARFAAVATALGVTSLVPPCITSLSAQDAQKGDLFVLLAGSDTFSIERFTRSPSQLLSEIVIKQAGARLRLTVDIGPGGVVSRFRMTATQASADPSSAPLQSLDARLTSDSVIADIAGGGKSTTQRFASKSKAIPFLNPSMALVELMTREARAAGGDNVAVPVWNAQGGRAMDVSVTRAGTDSLVVALGPDLRFAVSADGEITGGAIPSQNLRIVRVRNAGSTAMKVDKPDYSAPPAAPYTAEEVMVVSPKGHTLAGTLTIPKGAKGPVPAIVTITGSGPEDRDELLTMVKGGYRPFRQIADTLGRNGIAVLRMDDRGWGASKGNYAAATSADFADDIRAGLAYLRTRKEIDGKRLGLVGHSEGGLIAPMVAASDPTLRGIVLMAGPSQSGRTILNYQFRNGITRAPSLSQAQKDSALATVTHTIDSLGTASPWMKFFLDYDPLATARTVKVPTLVLQGVTDQQVMNEQADALAAALRAGGNKDVTVRHFPRANHLFIEDPDGNPAAYGELKTNMVRSDVLAAIVDWLTVKLR